MDTSTERMQAAQLDLSDFATSKLAPMVMWGGMLRLTGSAQVVAPLAAADLATGHTRWRVAWLTGTSVIFSEASKKLESWTAHSKGDDVDVADDLIVWSRRRSEISSVELTDATVRRRYRSEDELEWRSGARITFRDGFHLDVPLFDDRPGNQEDRGRVQAFIEAAADFTAG